MISATSLLLLLAFSSPRKVAMADDACTRQLSLDFNITKEHVPTEDPYKILTSVRNLPAAPSQQVALDHPVVSEPGFQPPALDALAKKYRPFIDRVMTRLSEAERKEVNLHYQADYRQSWICLSFANRGIAEPFVEASYQMYGVHPSKVWERIVADRKARLGAEYYDWYDSADILRPDVPKIPPTTANADTHAAHGADLSTGTVGGSVPLSKGEIV